MDLKLIVFVVKKIKISHFENKSFKKKFNLAQPRQLNVYYVQNKKSRTT